MNQIIHLESVIKMPLMNLPVRSTYIQIKDRGLLISPGSRLNEDQLKSLPLVTEIIAPNLLHTTGVPKAKAMFPNAITWGPIGVKEKRPDITWDHIINQEIWPFSEEVDILPLGGIDSYNEIVFLHKSSKTLIVADLVFNLENVNGLGPFVILKLFGTYKRFAISRLFLKFVTDLGLFQKSVSQLKDYDFTTVAMSHGNLVTENAKNRLINAFNERGLFIS